ncbi:arsenate reductase (glutaredoxin) [Sulfurimonas paralvinellae]|uniref:Arsenate reductase (Glutaredoxin) n=1 Tax=Sulfurimonas paralvinellae TaxID=317658 RepID=A0A7M1BA83_9BACT|nr:arsenate reductase (glutaredoxin) [Sulfurimonas paralvinellae]QOP46555.1 arsenate reductase (glutaredoxin) [Sulfurimonas paralvinellae]
MKNVQIWHNPRCSKSRQALALLDENGVEKDVVKYLEENPDKETIEKLLKMLGFTSARELMRTKEDIYKELNLKDETDESKLIDAMVEHPKLIERPIIIKGDKAIIARPPEKVTEFLKD